MFTPLSELIFT